MADSFLVRKLRNYSGFSEDDVAALENAASAHPVSVGSDVDLVRDGQHPTHVQLILQGMACRYKIDAAGGRQIMALLLPGDICDLHVFILDKMDHAIGTLTTCRVVRISKDTIDDLLRRRAVAKALWWSSLVDEATLREWLVNIGSRSAEIRIAHLFCEMHARYAAIGLAEDGEFSFPLSQATLGDTLGLSSVHVNRSLQSLRSRGLVRVNNATVQILEIPALERFAEFDASYLHLGHRNLPVHGSLLHDT